MSQVPVQANSKMGSSKSERVQEITARISAKLDSRYARYQEFFAKVDQKRSQLSSKQVDTAELDRQMRVVRSDMGKLSVELTEAKAALSTLEGSKASGELVSQATREVARSRAAFAKVHAQAKQIVAEIDKLSN